MRQAVEGFSNQWEIFVIKNLDLIALRKRIGTLCKDLNAHREADEFAIRISQKTHG